MGVVNTTYTFSGTDTITSSKLNNIIDDTTFTGDAIQGTTLQIVSPGKLAVSAGGITSNELASGAVSNINVSNTAAIAGTKISPDFGAQNITTTGNASIGQLTAKFSIFGNYTGVFQGISIQNNDNSAAYATVSFIDTVNNLGIADTHIFSKRFTDGGSQIEFGVTPVGSRSTDRRVPAVYIQPNSNMLVESVSCDNLNNRTKLSIKGFNNANTDDAIIFIPSIAK
jgi:hypothetical protein